MVSAYLATISKTQFSLYSSLLQSSVRPGQKCKNKPRFPEQSILLETIKSKLQSHFSELITLCACSENYHTRASHVINQATNKYDYITLVSMVSNKALLY